MGYLILSDNQLEVPFNLVTNCRTVRMMISFSTLCISLRPFPNHLLKIAF